MKHTKEQKELSESLLAACKAAGIGKPRFIAQDADGSVCHYGETPIRIDKIGMWADNETTGTCVQILNRAPYADDWKESLLEWVEPRNADNSLLDVLSNALASDESANDACKIAYRSFVGEQNYEITAQPSMSDIYHRAWQDAMKWEGGSND